LEKSIAGGRLNPLNTISVLEIKLHDQMVGYLAGFSNGQNILSFSDEFKKSSSRPTFSLTTHPDFPRSADLLAKPWVKRQKLHPVLSNLLPEGALREFFAQGLKVHLDSEFHLLSYLGQDLPGAIVATPVHAEVVPQQILQSYGPVKIVELESTSLENKFSLAGVQMKFSMKEKDGRFNLTKAHGIGKEFGDWIIKTPSTKHVDVPLNEYTAMSLASLVGVDIPQMNIVEIDKLDHLPPINLPQEKFAFAIKRFDREDDHRIHMEDFAQVMVKYPHEKYRTVNYEQIGKVIYQYSGHGLMDIQQFARRLLTNILLGNGDAHLKNWSFLYKDKVTPRLSPAYDIVTTNAYIVGEKSYALNLANNRDWYKVTLDHFEHWAKKADLPWRAIVPHLNDVMDKARVLWPDALEDLPMNERHKKVLKEHWKALHMEFRILV
jgi:serine/threonine-protein kinase HipA